MIVPAAEAVITKGSRYVGRAVAGIVANGGLLQRNGLLTWRLRSPVAGRRRLADPFGDPPLPPRALVLAFARSERPSGCRRTCKPAPSCCRSLPSNASVAIEPRS